MNGIWIYAASNTARGESATIQTGTLPAKTVTYWDTAPVSSEQHFDVFSDRSILHTTRELNDLVKSETRH
ncbi:hypothetical protein N7474_002773 [Penicillium riverlandense]|uniref:uncharacterized protein n=1 Tax=Penicillium riverlandense TaxID=1903569 RepID=UPI002546A7D1|nr:uncharacterized protein N7474_002773 [Penicillium riverlandense]KAJ5825635.1 hypothetical protein N7474_002773 [Penicillium riverlandense]